MRMRNPGPYTYDLPTLGVRLLPGDEIDHPDLLAGCELIEDEKSRTRSKGTVVASSGDSPAKEVD